MAKDVNTGHPITSNGVNHVTGDASIEVGKLPEISNNHSNGFLKALPPINTAH